MNTLVIVLLLIGLLGFLVGAAFQLRRKLDRDLLDDDTPPTEPA